MFKTSLSTNLSTNATQIEVQYNEIDDDNNYGDDFDKKFIF